MTGNLAGSFSFDSKESTTFSHQPELEIYFNGPAGPQGPQGAQGPRGLSPAHPVQQVPRDSPVRKAHKVLKDSSGPTGPQGLQGPAGANGQGFNFRNVFDNSVAYAINDVVTYGGSTYVAITSSQGPNNPTPNVNSAA